MGSVVALSDVNSVLVERYTYDVFGRPTIRDANGVVIDESAFGNPYLFTGRAWDAETALYYYRARYYDYATARFLQPDPIGYTDGLNLYAYVGNNPLMRGDPSGLCRAESALQQSALGRAILGLSGYGVGFGEAITGFLGGVEYAALHPWTLSPVYQFTHARETAAHLYGAGQQFLADITSPDAERNGLAIGRLTGSIFMAGAASAIVEGITRDVTARLSTTRGSRPPIAQEYFDKLQDRAPMQAAPYEIRPTYNPDGTVRSYTTYDGFGNRAYQYEVAPDVKHGPGYHSYDNSRTGGLGDGPRTKKHIPF